MKAFWWSLIVAVLIGAVPERGSAQPSLQARIDAAAPGDTIAVDGGTHDGPFVIDEAIALVGTNGAHLKGDEQTHVVTIAAPGVTLQGFRITDSGTQLAQDHAGVMIKGHRATVRDNHLADVLHGIYVKGKNRAVIAENTIEGPPTVTRKVTPDEARQYAGCSVPPAGGSCEVPLVSAQRGNGIHLWNALHSTITHNTVHHTRDGTYFSHSDHAYTAHNTIHDVRYGLHFMYSDDNTFEHNVFHDNASGSALMFSDDITVRPPAGGSPRRRTPCARSRRRAPGPRRACHARRAAADGRRRRGRSPGRASGVADGAECDAGGVSAGADAAVATGTPGCGHAGGTGAAPGRA